MIDRSKLEEKIVEFQRREAELKGMVDTVDQLRIQMLELQRSIDVLSQYPGNTVLKQYGTVIVSTDKTKLLEDMKKLQKMLEDKVKEFEQQIKIKGEALERMRSALEQELKEK
ncbi:MAG: prefoldin subunit [Candidatus Micrarchaeota archaeon]|nr:prefoldin subunit [Candidatus Micrarchaeota archaeon]MCX8154761.1 prefoldin subunit [Candidatus Micrarchaeota archaeon]